MAIGTKDQFQVYDLEYQVGKVETLEQYSDEMATATNGAIQIVSRNMLGDFEKQAFFKLTNDLVVERDPTSTADLPPKGLAQGELIGVKLNRSILSEQTLDSFRKIGEDPAVMSFILGQMAGREVALDYLNTGLLCLATAIGTESGMVLDVADDTTPVTLTPLLLNQARAKLGDAGLNKIRCWVMASKPFYDLIGNQIVEKVTGLSDVVVYGGSVGSLGIPIYVTDSPSLIDGDEYTILGLTEDALVLTDSEDDAILTEVVGGKANLIARVQAEWSYNVNVKGFSYASATKSPSKAVLGTAATWEYQMADVKSGAGVKLVCN